MTGILCALPLIGAPTAASSGTSPLTVTLSATSVSASGTTSSLTTGSVTATVTGGTAPYTKAWALSSGDTSTAATSPTAVTTSFQRTGCVAGNTYNSSWKCTVTDSASNSKLSSACSAAIVCTGAPAVDWANISASSAYPASAAVYSQSGSNAAVTPGVAGTLNFSNNVTGSYASLGYVVVKNGASQGQVTSLTIVATDTVYFTWTMTGRPDTQVTGTFTVSGAATDTFTVDLSINSTAP